MVLPVALLVGISLAIGLNAEPIRGRSEWSW